MHTTDTTITVRYFGLLAEHIGIGEERLQFPTGTTVQQVRGSLCERHPALRNLKYRIAVDTSLPADGAIIDGCAELALLPPFAGG
ncbi:MAG: MoaD/ThiS family protein [Flavobacteriales bacterium]|nr:MoaD/ThiS family protein [Flavobacteriales bacterium]